VGKKRRMTHSGKFKNKLSSHPRTKIMTLDTIVVTGDININPRSEKEVLSSVVAPLEESKFDLSPEVVATPKVQEVFLPPVEVVQPEPAVKISTRSPVKKSRKKPSARKRSHRITAENKRSVSKTIASSSERVDQSNNN
tara:strand:- start:61 stop:477 length:417 start_codon:yes stop_codon:yes gene_type:complete